MASQALADILEALPQTQCGKCGFGGCLPYAQAIVSQQAPINRCPPGGTATMTQLATLTGQPVPDALDPEVGPMATQPTAAVIDPAWCIGCTKCIQACPVDAIVGAPKYMHTVIATDCTGCGLCIPPCPTDCIQLIPVSRPASDAPWPEPLGPASRARYEARQQRLAQETIRHQAAMNTHQPAALLTALLGTSSPPPPGEPHDGS